MIQSIDNRTKVLALVCLIAEALFLGSLPVLPSDQILYALMTCAVILLVMVIGIVFLESRGTDSHTSITRAGFDHSADFATVHGRRRAVIGKWAGTLKQQFRGEWISPPVEMEFKVDDGFLEGSVTIDHPEGPDKPRIKLSVVNSFFHEPFLKLDYRNATDSVLQFGCWIARLNAEGTQLEGRFVGYGSISDRIVSGEVHVRKLA